MSRFPKLSRTLRQTLQALVLATLPASAAVVATGCCAGYEDPQSSQVVAIDPESDAYRDLVKDCRDDDLACLNLCETILEEQGIAWPGEVAFSQCTLIERDETEVHMTYSWPEGCVSGRRPAGLRACPDHTSASAVGAWIRQTAYLEAASVPAFVTVARELREFGAPAALAERALVAAADEIRHARAMVALARRYRVQLSPPRLNVPERRSLIDLCIDNAVEGCVRETYGAVVATWQAHMAGDPAIRAVMATIAREETEHAELSADIHAWALSLLDSDARASLWRAQQRAVADLLAVCDGPIPADLVALAGLPDRAHGLALCRQVAQLVARRASQVA